LTTRSLSLLDVPSRERPGSIVKPCATSCELRYWRLEVDATEFEDVLEIGEPNCENETSSAQWTSFLGVNDMSSQPFGLATKENLDASGSRDSFRAGSINYHSCSSRWPWGRGHQRPVSGRSVNFL
jgi:hypothetical protein